MNKVLIVDDSAFARSKIRAILEDADYEVTEAENGAHAVELAQENPPDIVTLDLLMPVLPGLDTLKQLREIYPQVKIVIVSADIQNQTRDEMLAAGADAFLNKPVSRESLLNTFDQL